MFWLCLGTAGFSFRFGGTWFACCGLCGFAFGVCYNTANRGFGVASFRLVMFGVGGLVYFRVVWSCLGICRFGVVLGLGCLVFWFT